MKIVMKQNRRKFFGLVTASAAGAFISRFVPFKLNAAVNENAEISTKPEAKIHPQAVSRTKRSAV